MHTWTMNLAGAAWYKSSRSAGNGNCVEVAVLDEAVAGQGFDGSQWPWYSSSHPSSGAPSWPMRRMASSISAEKVHTLPDRQRVAAVVLDFVAAASASNQGLPPPGPTHQMALAAGLASGSS